MRTVSDIIDDLGGNTVVARILGKGPSTVSEMRRRGRIDVRYWPALVAAAADAKVPLTNDMLVAAHTKVAA